MVHLRCLIAFAALAAGLCLACGFDKDKQNPSGDFSPPSGSGGSGGGDTAAGGVSYAQTIAPMMAANCAFSGCHGASNFQAGVRLDTYPNVVANAAAANADIQDQSMPPGGPLSATDRQSFQDWVNAGTPNN